MAIVYSEKLEVVGSVAGDHSGGFAIDVPDGWLIDRSGRQGARVLFLDPQPIGSFQANINVVVQLLGTMTADEYITLSRLQIKQLTVQAALELDETLEKNTGRLFEWHGQLGTLHLKVRQLIVCACGSAYVVSATALYACFGEYRDRFRAALDSFRLAGALRDYDSRNGRGLQEDGTLPAQGGTALGPQ